MGKIFNVKRPFFLKSVYFFRNIIFIFYGLKVVYKYFLPQMVLHLDPSF